MKNIFAAFVFFTRLPLWKLKMFQFSPKYFENVINYWAVVGWLTGAVMAATLWLAAQVFPLSVSILFALLSRLLLTGALHEDGLADFFDAFGGGTNKQRILEIMKDSHIGTYGVLALVVYFLMSLHILQSFATVEFLCIVLFTSDAFSKLVVSTLTCFLPYARTQATSKSGVVYRKMQLRPFLVSCFFGLFPLVLLPDWRFLFAFALPIFLYACLVVYLRKKIKGYTGDCCGALFLLSEFSAWVGILVVYNLSWI